MGTVMEDEAKLTDLKNSLQQVLEKLESQISIIPEVETVRQNQEIFKKRSQDKAEQAKAAIAEYRNVASKHEKESAANYCRLEALKHSLENQQKLIETGLLDQEKIQRETDSLITDCMKKKQELLSASDVAKQKARDMERGLQLSKDHLHLEIKNISGGRLQIIFTMIDPKDVRRPFYFCVKIMSSDRAYSVTECCPEVADLPALVEKLNQTNNLRSFIITMRSRFKALV